MGITSPDTTAQAAAADIRSRMAQMEGACRDHLRSIIEHTNTHGRAALATALAPDGAELLTVFNAFRAAVIAAGTPIDELPA